MNARGVMAGSVLVACTALPAAGSPSDDSTRANDPTPTPMPGSRFREDLRSGGQGPEMVVIPTGRFRMGCLSGDDYCWDQEQPVREVTFGTPFALSVYEVTFEEYDLFTNPDEVPDGGWGRGRRPVINVSRDDAHAYVAWLSTETGGTYRLPSEAEWEYAARAGTVGKYHWGDEIGEGRANCHGCGSPWGERQTAPVGSFTPNGFGLHDMLGNVWEWVEDDWQSGLWGIPPDGSPWLRERRIGAVVRGGSWGFRPRLLRAAVRLAKRPTDRNHFVGFRVARTLTPLAPAEGKPSEGSAAARPASEPVAATDAEATGDPTVPTLSRAVPGSTFHDFLRSGGKGPEMVVIPAGSFRKGCLSNDESCAHRELPAHDVTIRQAFALSVHEVTFEDYDRFTVPEMVRDMGWGRGRQPAINVSWHDAIAYAAWLSAQTGAEYRLPSESEWEYAARAGTTTKYHWGDEIGVNRANCVGCGSPWADRRTAPVGSFAPNRFGLYDMHGNVFEWVEDCCEWRYDGRHPPDGTPCYIRPCWDRGLRGGSWRDLPTNVRAAYRDHIFPGMRDSSIGFRVARTLAP